MGCSSSTNFGGHREMLEPLSQDMTKRTSAGGASDSSPDARKVCFIISHLEKPVAYQIYLIDARDLRCNSGSSTIHDENDWTKQQMQNLTPAIELPSGKYPMWMGFFNVGSRVYMLGGERGVHFPRTRSQKSIQLERSVYVCDTASPPPLSIKPVRRMNGGKFNPHVSHVNGKVYVLSFPLSRSTHGNTKTALFESFDPKAETWSALPNPPFYDSGDTEYPNIRRSAMVMSNTVARSKIFFYTPYEEDFLYAFDTDCSRWETFPLPEFKWQCFPFRNGSVPIPDYDMWATAGYHFQAHASVPGKGLISKDIEGLSTLLNDHPSLYYYSVKFHVLESKEGWFCLLKSGSDAEPYTGGKSLLLASVFRLVENRKEKVAASDVQLFPSHESPGPARKKKKGAHPDCEKIVGEVSVLAAADLRSSLFNIESQHSVEDSVFVASFIFQCGYSDIRQ